MKANILLIIAVFLLLLPLSNAFRIDIDVAENLRAKFVNVNYTVENGILNTTVEFYNSGSVPYKVRMRMETESSGTIYSVWSDNRNVFPSDHAVFNFYWRPKNKNTVNTTLRAYFGNEILGYNQTELLLDPRGAEDIFTVSDVKTFDDRIEFYLSSNQTVRAYITPVKYLPGWSVQQVQADTGGQKTRIFLPYNPDVFSDNSITVSIFSDDGMYYGEKILHLKKEAPDKFRGVLATVIQGALSVFLKMI